MDQVTNFMNKRLSANKRTEDDKTLTKTMINNYTKNELLPPSNKKRYSKDHLILLIYIYYLKSVMPISDIQTILSPMISDYYDNEEASHSLEEIYENLYELEKYQYFNVENSIVNAQQIVMKNKLSKDDEYLQKFNFLASLAYDIFTKRKLMEKIIDDMREQQENAKQEAQAQAEAERKAAKQAVKKAASKTPAKNQAAKAPVKASTKAPAKASQTAKNPVSKNPAKQTASDSKKPK